MVNLWFSQSMSLVKRSLDQERNVIKSRTDDLQKIKVAMETANLYGNALVDHGKDAQVAVLKYEVKKRIDDLLHVESHELGAKLKFRLPTRPERLGMWFTLKCSHVVER